MQWIDISWKFTKLIWNQLQWVLCIFRTWFACRGSFLNRRSDPKSWNSIRMTLHKIMHLNHNFWHLSTKNFHYVTLKKSESVVTVPLLLQKTEFHFFHQNWWWPFLNAKTLDSFSDLLPNCVASKKAFHQTNIFEVYTHQHHKSIYLSVYNNLTVLLIDCKLYNHKTCGDLISTTIHT